MIKIYVSFKNFLQKFIFSLPDDIEKPFQKIINLVLKIVGIGLVIFAIYLLAAATQLFFIYKTILNSPIIDSKIEIVSQEKENLNNEDNGTIPQKIIQNKETFSGTFEKEELADRIVMILLFSIGFMAVSVFISLVLLVRYLVWTLPDRIYLRCYSSIEEKRKKCPVPPKCPPLKKN